MASESIFALKRLNFNRPLTRIGLDFLDDEKLKERNDRQKIILSKVPFKE
jgi:hypothetical protein